MRNGSQIYGKKNMKIVKKCVACDKKVNCEECRGYCITFDDGEPYITIPLSQELNSITLYNSKDVKFEVYSAMSGDIIADNLQTYYDEDFEEFRIFPSSLYERLEILYTETN